MVSFVHSCLFTSRIPAPRNVAAFHKDCRSRTPGSRPGPNTNDTSCMFNNAAINMAYIELVSLQRAGKKSPRHCNSRITRARRTDHAFIYEAAVIIKI